jgi:hypothetical protein
MLPLPLVLLCQCYLCKHLLQKAQHLNYNVPLYEAVINHSTRLAGSHMPPVHLMGQKSDWLTKDVVLLELWILILSSLVVFSQHFFDATYLP